MSITTDIKDSFVAAQHAQSAYCEAITEFNVACSLGDDAAAEVAREKVIGAIESFMDNHAAAYRRMRDVGGPNDPGRLSK